MADVGTTSLHREQLDCRVGLHGMCGALRRPGQPTLLLDGSGGFDVPWRGGPLLALEPKRVPLRSAGLAGALAEVEGRLERRRRIGGSADTGVALLVAYEGWEAKQGPDAPGLPHVVALAVDASLRLPEEGGARLTVRGGDGRGSAQADTRVAVLRDMLQRLPGLADDPAAPLRATRPPRTSLPRRHYLRAVERVREHIARGDIYQANLCQQFSGDCSGDAFGLYRKLSTAAPAPRSAFLETGSFALLSISPEVFVSIEDGVAETYPIKGTRPRGATPEDDRAAREALLASDKDRAELLMIVDLERNDLGRICRTGTVETPELAGLRSFATVHHLVARVRGRLKDDVGLEALLRATFPGGSITGAPKIRAMEILRELEPCPRGYFTGCLFWFGDDGTIDSSILIRTLTVAAGRFYLGAGGGVVADSEPEAEWRESNHKARALARALGFDPEEAG